MPGYGGERTCHGRRPMPSTRTAPLIDIPSTSTVRTAARRSAHTFGAISGCSSRSKSAARDRSDRSVTVSARFACAVSGKGRVSSRPANSASSRTNRLCFCLKLCSLIVSC